MTKITLLSVISGLMVMRLAYWWLSVVAVSHHPPAIGNKPTLPDLIQTNGNLAIQLIEFFLYISFYCTTSLITDYKYT